jgi:hypothetical protein
MVAFAVGFATSAILDFQSFQECEDGAGEGAAFAGPAGGTSTMNFETLVAVAQMMGAESTVTVVAPLSTRTECSTSTVASDSAVGRKLACRAGHAVVIVQMRASLTVECGKKLGESPIGSSSRPPSIQVFLEQVRGVLEIIGCVQSWESECDPAIARRASVA